MSARSDPERGVYAQLDPTLEENLVGPSPGTVLPTTTATPMMEVVAPATLAEDYTFDAEFGGQTFSIKVPKGGVEEGQKFLVPLPQDGQDAAAAAVLRRISVPVGHWKDGLCDCFTHGVCHNHIWVSVFCAPVAAAQVMARLQLNWRGEPGSIAETAGVFRLILYLVIILLATMYIPSLIIGDYAEQPEDAPTWAITLMVIQELSSYIYFVWSILVVWRVRKHIRAKYAIPESEACSTGCEDACCAIWCTYLTAAQMLRHTTDYDTYHATCFTETGLPPNVPSIV